MTSPSQSETRSILVAEVTGEAPLLGKIGAVETNRAVERCRNRAERSIESNQGHILQSEGRRLVAYFSRSENAMLTAFDMRSRVGQLPPVSGVSLSVRIAVHTGPLDGLTDGPAPAAVELTQIVAKGVAANQVAVTTEAVASLPETMRPYLDSETVKIDGYDLPLYHIKQGSTPPPREVFSPTATSIAMFQFQQPTADIVAPPPPVQLTAAAATPRTSLMLRHENHNFVVSDLRPVLLAGREDGNDLVIADKRASRHHSRIEWRQDRFVLIDTSTNGTYMIDDAGNEVILRRSEAQMPVRGRIGFGYSPTETGAEVVFFDVGQR